MFDHLLKSLKDARMHVGRCHAYVPELGNFKLIVIAALIIRFNLRHVDIVESMIRKLIAVVAEDAIRLGMKENRTSFHSFG